MDPRLIAAIARRLAAADRLPDVPDAMRRRLALTPYTPEGRQRVLGELRREGWAPKHTAQHRGSEKSGYIEG
jgi:hypothetical protein